MGGVEIFVAEGDSRRPRPRQVSQPLVPVRWKWALSLVLVGGYIEERRNRFVPWMVVRRVLRPWSFNFLRPRDFHRVDLIDGEAWTLFLVGPKVTHWFFWDRETGREIPWREFLASKQVRPTT